MRTSLKRRLTSLCFGELLAIALFIPASYLMNNAAPELHLYKLVSFWYSFILLIFLLLQGSYYWYSKLARLNNEQTSATPITVVRLLDRLKNVNVVLLIMGILPFVVDVIRFSADLPKTGLGIALCIYLFTVLEFVNYFYIQLSYNSATEIITQLKRRQWKPSSLRKDIKRYKNSLHS